MRWSVTLEAGGDRVLTHAEVLELADAVAVHSGIASGIGSDHYGAQLVVEADDEATAIATARRHFTDAAAGAGLPPWPIDRVEAVSEADEQAWNDDGWTVQESTAPTGPGPEQA